MNAPRILRATARWLVASSVLVLSSCSEKQMSDGSLTQGCRPSIIATGKEVRQSHPSKPSECKFAVVMFCNACVYDAEGALSHSVSEPCGICMKFSTP